MKTVSEFTFSSPQDIENFRVIKDKATIVEKEFDTSSMQKGMKGTIKITVKQNENSENPFSIQSFVKPDEEIKIIKGNTYEMAFYARASSPVAFLVQVMTDDSPWEMPAKNARYNCSLLQDWKKISYTFTADKTIEKARIPCFILGQVPAGTSIWFSSIKLDTIKIEKKDIPKKIEAKLSLFDMSDSIINPLTPSILRWVIKNTNNIPGIENGTLLSYEINDYNGNNITKGSVKITNTSYFEIPVKLPQGYFEIAFSGYEYPFGICSYPLRENSDPFFSIATHLLMKKYDGKKEAAIKFLNKSGLRRIRDQYVFKFINPDENKYDFDTDYQFEKLHTWYNENNIETFFVFHTMKPQWIETQPGDQYPLNFIQCQNSWSGIIKHWNTNWCAIEVWNEPDLKKAPLDGYVALVKAFRYALEKSKTPGNKVPIIGGIFSTPFVEKKFLEICERNHLLDYIDIFSYHTYFYAETIEESVDYYRSWLKKNNKTSMPIWITESGRSWPVGRIRPTMSQGQVSALDITMKAVESKACGIAGYYPF
ncbi:MAG TPA: hypothetical protein DC049_06345, partial [Spirochaetia bacterium]|nr:hypothetical protein [Spirochaetia bacterium]